MTRARSAVVPIVLPMRNGVSPSTVVLPSVGAGTMLDFLAARFPAVGRDQWQQRMLAGDVVDACGQAVAPQRAFEPHLRLYYYRSLAVEPEIPFYEEVLYQDAHLLVADKPHFLPVVPAGRYVRQTLLARLKERLGLPELSPLHRIDRDTAGLVLFSVQRATRGLYQGLFREQAMVKHYEAVAPCKPGLEFPREHHSRLEENGQFFLMHEVPGSPNSHTRMELLEVSSGWARYRLSPVTGKRHQLRVHMAALGLPLRYDPFYPEVNDPPEGDFSRPLQLLAQSLAFDDPLTGQHRRFVSGRQLLPLA
ncbi:MULTISPECIES: pseudouridine synthase [Giesbergeria]|uniref:Pseudouridine synthase n=1 Tax=Giesbergeria sinuosa TaxID=80883 RepID=A0ABV9Q8G4_9BURK